LIRLYEHTPNYEYCPTGIDELDEKILGLHKGALTIIVAPTGLGKSLAPYTPVLRYDGKVVKAIDVKVGDQLMGPDSKPRNVTNVNLQKGPMYRVTPTKGDPFDCNEDHILSLKHTTTNEVKNVVLKDYLSWSKTQKHLWKLWRVGFNTTVVQSLMTLYLFHMLLVLILVMGVNITQDLPWVRKNKRLLIT
jgi:replicative DNA helicase